VKGPEEEWPQHRSWTVVEEDEDEETILGCRISFGVLHFFSMVVTIGDMFVCVENSKVEVNNYNWTRPC
jgi:hypothetical protein